MKNMLQILLTLTLICTLQTESRTVKSKFNVNQVIMNDDSMMDDVQVQNVQKCEEISTLMLNDILGAAFNSRCAKKFLKFSNLLKKGHLFL